MSQVNPTRISPPKRYDADGEFLSPAEWELTQEYAADILKVITEEWITGPEIRRQTGTDRVRLWSDAIALLCDQIETKDGDITRYRLHAMRETPKPDKYKSQTAIFSRRDVDMTYPTKARTRGVQ